MDLTNLTPEEKQELLILLQQKELIEKETILSRIKLHHKQAAFHQDKRRIRMFCGGNGAGKTFTIVHELAHTHLKTHPHRDVSSISRTWFWVPDLKKVEDYLETLRKICPPSRYPQIDKLGTPNPRRLVWDNGDTTTFFSYEQDDRAAESTNIDAAFFDEPPPRNIYIATYRGLRSNPDHFVCLALTGVDQPWLYEDLYVPGTSGENPNIGIFVSNTLDNRDNIDLEWFKQFESSLTEDEKKVRIEGEFAVLQGRVFKEFKRELHVVKWKPWPKDWPVYLGLDPHTRKKSVAVWMGVTKDEELVVLDEAEADSIVELGNVINALEKRRGFNVVRRVIDNSGSSRDWSGSSAVEMLRDKCNLRVTPVTNEEKDVDESIFRIKRLLMVEKLKDGREMPRLFFMENCRESIKEMELYGWRDNRNPETSDVSEKVKKVYDDHIDPIRYIVMQRPRHTFNFEPISYASGYQKRDKNLLKRMLQ